MQVFLMQIMFTSAACCWRHTRTRIQTAYSFTHKKAKSGPEGYLTSVPSMPQNDGGVRRYSPVCQT